MKTLSIVIPQYNETDAEARPLLQSIDIQRGVDFEKIEVIVVNGGSDKKLTDKFLKSFANIRPRYVTVPKEDAGSPGLSRQYGCDVAEGEYITFCDCDDIYHSVGTLSLYFDIIRQQRPQTLGTSWLEEIKDQEGNYIYVKHEHENTWMHGKLFLRSFLAYNNIRYSKELLYHEDSYYNAILMSVVEPDKVAYADVITYVWTFDEGSITRRNQGAYAWESMEEFTHAIRLANRWIKERNPEKVPYGIAQLLLYVYYVVTSNLDVWEQKYVDNTEREWYATYKEFEEEFKSVPFEVLSTLQLQERQKVRVPFIEKVTFFDFIAQMEIKFGGTKDADAV